MKSGSTLTDLLRSSQRIVRPTYEILLGVLTASLPILAIVLLMLSWKAFLYSLLAIVLQSFSLAVLSQILKSHDTQNESPGSES